MKKAPLPDLAALRAHLATAPGPITLRGVAKAFGIKGGPGRAALRQMLHELAAEGADGAAPARPRGKRMAKARFAPPALYEVLPLDAEGELWATPLVTGLEALPGAPRPRYPLYADPRQAGAVVALSPGAKIWARLEEGEEAPRLRLLRGAAPEGARLLGLFRRGAEGGRILPVEKGAAREWRVAEVDSAGARDGELVEAEPKEGGRRIGLPFAKITQRLGDPMAPKAFSLIAIHHYGIEDHFTAASLAEAEAAAARPPEGPREDLRHLPFVTIDPPDARDRDDAVFAAPDDDLKNPGGFRIWVAIADVAAYVRPGGALDTEARRRGNSVYFPDRVVPMLPDALSGEACSLHEGVDRAVLVAEMVVDAQGQKRSHRFHRALIRSRAALSYAEVQAALDGAAEPKATPLLADVLQPLQAAYRALAKARGARAPLELDLPERKITLSAEGKVTAIGFPERLETHRLIEDFMILANVAAAEELTARKVPLLFRVHEVPKPEKIEALRELAEASGFSLAKTPAVTTHHLNRLLSAARGSPEESLIHISALRSLPQAYYSPDNLGHFGLALAQYAHFTSPIRRYADLIVHRALITAHRWGADGLSQADIETLSKTAEGISEAERRAMAAERDTSDRYLAAFLAERRGAEFAGHVSGVQRFGLFIRLDETGADGLLPMRALGAEYFHHDEAGQRLIGRESGLVLRLGQRVRVRLEEVTPASGGLLFSLLGIEGEAPRAVAPGGRVQRRFAPKGRGKKLRRK